MNLRTLFLIILGILIIALAGVLVFVKMPAPVDEPVQIGFSQEGTVVKDNPGLKAGVWYLVYEKSGSPALTKELDVSGIGNVNLQNGQKAFVKGIETSGVVKVSSLQILNA